MHGMKGQNKYHIYNCNLILGSIERPAVCSEVSPWFCSTPPLEEMLSLFFCKTSFSYYRENTE